MKTGVYTITNLINNKIYVGSTVFDFKYRESTHFTRLKKQQHSNIHLQRAWNKYGESNFKFEILEEWEPEYCLSMEQYWINMLDSCNKLIGYNILPNASNRAGSKHTVETIEKMRIIRKGTNVGSNNPMFGKSGLLNSRSKKVILYDLSGNKIKEFDSLNSITKELGIKTSYISQCCKGKIKKSKKYIFKYKNEGNNKK